MCEKELKTMGKGWFILKLAEDHGIKTGSNWNYGGNLKGRLSYYNKTLSKHPQMILYIVDNWNNRIKSGSPILKNSELYDIALQLIKHFNLKVKNKGKIVSNIKKSNSSKKARPKFIFNENDCDGDLIFYERNVKENERVDGLCSFLECNYRSIIDHLFKFVRIDHFPMVRVILSKKRPTHKIENNVAEWILNEVKHYGKNITEERINEIIDNKEVTLAVTGRFYPNRGFPYIVIYYRNIIEKDRYKYFVKVLATLAHEYFHYFHYLFTNRRNLAKKDEWEYLSVNESLAEIFSYDYLTKNFIQYALDVANDKYQYWKKYFGSKVPYAQALRYFDSNNKINLQKVDEVLSRSRFDMYDAFRVLINM